MLLLPSTTTKIQVITSAAGTVKVQAAYADNASGAITFGPASQPAVISTAATTDVVAAPGASTTRSVSMLTVRNDHASVSQSVTVQITDGTTVIPLWAGPLSPGEFIVMNEINEWYAYANSGVQKSSAQTGTLWNNSTGSQGAGFATDTYVTGSSITIPAQGVKVGSKFRCSFDVSKTAAGTATPIITLRFGTNGSTADTAICAFTFGAGTAAADVGTFEVWGVFRTVGSGTSAVVQGRCMLTNLASTGLASTVKGVQTTSSGFNSTTAGSIIGVSVNGGASAAWTVQMVEAELSNV